MLGKLVSRFVFSNVLATHSSKLGGNFDIWLLKNYTKITNIFLAKDF